MAEARPNLRSDAKIGASLILAPAAWAASTQLGEILPYADCANRGGSSALAALSAAVIAAASAGVSLHGISRPCMGGHPTMRFIGLVGALTALVFAYALGLQTVAALVLSGCER